MEAVVNEAGLRAAFAGKRILVTGHTGFKGSWLALWLTRLGAEVTGLSDAIPTSPSHFEALDLAVDDRRGDIADQPVVEALISEVRPEVVFHLAAQSLVRRAYRDPVGTYRTNVMGTLTLFDACRRQGGVRAIVSATTDKVYRNIEQDAGYREDDALGGADPYSASKSCVELMTASFRESYPDSAMSIASVRAGNVIGGGDWAEDRLIPDAMRAVSTGEPLAVRNPDSTRPWQHVLDPLAGYLEVGARLLSGDQEAAGSWNFGPAHSQAVRVRDILDLLCDEFPGLQVHYRPASDGLHEARLLQLDSSKARAMLGWRPRWEGQMLERTVQWYRAFHRDGRAISAQQIDDYVSAGS